MSICPQQQAFIRAMQIDDLADVLAIEQATSQSPWSELQFEQSMHDTVVLICDTRLVGFLVLGSVLDQAEVHNLAIHPQHQGEGLGSALLDHGIDSLAPEITVLHLEVRVSNFRAIRLYQQRGFVEVGERRDYYKTEYGRENALLMSRSLATDAE